MTNLQALRPEMDMPAKEETQLRASSGQRHAVVASFLGWTLDAFDFFVLVFLVDTLATHFQVSKAAIIWSITATLAMRPIGAIAFGMLADRFGRRRALIANVLFFSTVEVLCGFAPTYATFLTLRALFGIGMGGEWGIGASLAMESAPKRWRGILSGLLQSGYPTGYLLAALAARFVLPAEGWRAMFWIGGLPALLTLYIRYRVPESEAWKQRHESSFSAIALTTVRHWKLLAYLTLLMTFMMFLSHGTQDLYPDFLKSAHQVSAAMVAYIAILYNGVAVVSAVTFGHLSERLGRRYTMIAAITIALLVIPAWAFGNSLVVLAAGACVMQAAGQGAWGIIPAHLNELCPDTIRGLLPGLAYQLGILLASGTGTIEYALRDRVGYSWALAGFETVNIVLLATIIAWGPEKKGRSFLQPD